MPDVSLLAVFLVGLLGGTHCAGMCGGVVAVLSGQLRPGVPALPFHFAYSAGRIASYTAAGAIAGALGASGARIFHDILPIQTGLFVLANVMLIALGAYLAGFGRFVMRLEAAGGWVWRHVEPYSRRWIPVRHWRQALSLGVVWGWLPCGMVYSVLITALATGSAARGALTMAAFGLGTLPNLLAMGLFAMQVKAMLQRPWVRRTAGTLTASYGVWGLAHVLH